MIKKEWLTTTTILPVSNAANALLGGYVAGKVANCTGEGKNILVIKKENKIIISIIAFAVIGALSQT